MFQLEELSKLRLRGVAKSGAILSDDLAVEECDERDSTLRDLHSMGFRVVARWWRHSSRGFDLRDFGSSTGCRWCRVDNLALLAQNRRVSAKRPPWNSAFP